MKNPLDRDPRRAVSLAVAATRVLGGIHLLLAALAVVGVAMSLGYNSQNAAIAFVIFAWLAILFLIPAVLYLVLAAWMKRLRLWAAVATIVAASLECLLFLVGAIHTSNVVGLAFLVLVLIGGSVVVAASRATTAIRRDHAGSHDRIYGFEPVMAAAPNAAAGNDPPVARAVRPAAATALARNAANRPTR